MTEKIVFGISLITTSLVVFVSILTVRRTESEFYNFVTQLETLVPRGYSLNIEPFVQLNEQFVSSLYITVFWASILGIILAIIFGVLVSKQITKPIKTLKLGLDELKRNNFNTQLANVDSAEFDELIDTFNLLSQRLNQNELLREELISDISHELRTPITSIMGQLQAIQDHIFEPTPERIDLILSQIKSLNHLIDELQNYTIIRSRTIKPVLKPVNTKKIVESIIKLRQTNLNEQNMQVEIIAHPDYYIDADEQSLTQILQNLIDNAIKYSKADQITVEISKVKLVVSDNGIGIPGPDRDKVFERFFRVEKSRNKSTGGLGLGLSISKELAEAHGWELKLVPSQKGCRFEIIF